MLRIDGRSHASYRGKRLPVAGPTPTDRRAGRSRRAESHRYAKVRDVYWRVPRPGECLSLDAGPSADQTAPVGSSAGDSGSPVVPGTKASGGEYLMSLEIDAWTSWSARLADSALRRAPQIERTVPCEAAQPAAEAPATPEDIP